MTPRELITKWRADADVLAIYDPRLAEVARRHAEQLEAAVRAEGDDVLDLTAAAKVSGYSVDRLRHKIAAGEIANIGRKGAPRVRKGDLPTKTRRARGAGFDAAAAARRHLGRGQPPEVVR
jgi:hypothetical protein